MAFGGFGCGGGTHGNTGGGGAGSGYSGGGANGQTDSTGEAGGGGSYDMNTSSLNVIDYNTPHGFVSITYA